VGGGFQILEESIPLQADKKPSCLQIFSAWGGTNNTFGISNKIAHKSECDRDCWKKNIQLLFYHRFYEFVKKMSADSGVKPTMSTIMHNAHCVWLVGYIR